MTIEDRFWSRVARSGDCWEWVGTRRPEGYGLFWTGERQVRAHRFAWELENGPIPVGLSLCHSCDNPPCVRPDHLYVGTQRENLEDMTRKGRRRVGQREQRGMKNSAAKLTDEQVAHIKGMAAAGHYHDDIAARFGTTPANVGYIARRTWSHIEPVSYPPAVRDRPMGRNAPAKRAALGR